MKKPLAFFILFFLLGCAASNNSAVNISASPSSDWVVQQARVKEDALHNIKIIAFPEVTDLPVPYGIAVIQKPNTPDMYVVYVNEDSGFLEEAQTENGNKLPIISIDSPVDDGNVSTTISGNVAIQINLAFLEKNRGKNPQIKVFGKQGPFTIFLPDYYIDAVLKYMRQR
jgi:hypothetical protein